MCVQLADFLQCDTTEWLREWWRLHGHADQIATLVQKFERGSTDVPPLLILEGHPLTDSRRSLTHQLQLLPPLLHRGAARQLLATHAQQAGCLELAMCEAVGTSCGDIIKVGGLRTLLLYSPCRMPPSMAHREASRCAAALGAHAAHSALATVQLVSLPNSSLRAMAGALTGLTALTQLALHAPTPWASNILEPAAELGALLAQMAQLRNLSLDGLICTDWQLEAALVPSSTLQFLSALTLLWPQLQRSMEWRGLSTEDRRKADAAMPMVECTSVIAQLPHLRSLETSFSIDGSPLPGTLARLHLIGRRLRASDLAAGGTALTALELTEDQSDMSFAAAESFMPPDVWHLAMVSVRGGRTFCQECDRVQELTQLTYLDLHCTSTRDAMVALTAVLALSQLRTLRLPTLQFQRRRGGAHAPAPPPTLTTVRLQAERVTALTALAELQIAVSDARHDWARTLWLALGALSGLTALHCEYQCERAFSRWVHMRKDGQEVTVEAVKPAVAAFLGVFAQLTALRELTAKLTRLEAAHEAPQESKPVMPVLSAHSALHAVRLAGLQLLPAALPGAGGQGVPTLRSLHASECSYGSDGAGALAQYLTSIDGLTRIALPRCDRAAAQGLAIHLYNVTRIADLQLDFDSCDAAAKFVPCVLTSMTGLTRLAMSTHSAQDTQLLANALPMLVCLHVFATGCCQGERDHCEAVSEVLEALPSLHTVCVGYADGVKADHIDLTACDDAAWRASLTNFLQDARPTSHIVLHL